MVETVFQKHQILLNMGIPMSAKLPYRSGVDISATLVAYTFKILRAKMWRVFLFENILVFEIGLLAASVEIHHHCKGQEPLERGDLLVGLKFHSTHPLNKNTASHIKMKFEKLSLISFLTCPLELPKSLSQSQLTIFHMLRVNTEPNCKPLHMQKQ
jgi:hypothetical protein